MSLLSELFGVAGGGYALRSQLGNYYAQQQQQAALYGLGNASPFLSGLNAAAFQNALPLKPQPSPHDFDLWIADPRPLTFDEWCAERYG